jgi:hypothetical protein
MDCCVPVCVMNYSGLKSADVVDGALRQGTFEAWEFGLPVVANG